MEDYNRIDTIKLFTEKILNKEMEFSDMRKTLKSQDIDDQEIKTVISLVDRKVQREELRKVERQKGKSLFYVGIVIVSLALILTIGSFTGLIDLKGYGIIAYGPIAAGLIMIFKGQSLMNS